ncbi:MAG: hypothetical protein JXN59_03340 [Anaerolineae bacterium]|nr:hypothetical protein [Anaerolineae bacterium]
MTDQTPSVRVEPLLGYPALLMTFEHQVIKEEMEAAFAEVHAAQEGADRKLFLVLDLTKNPQLEVLEVVTAAVPVFRHPRSAKWLIIGQSGLGHVIESKLATLSRRTSDVLWFETEAEAYDYLRMIDEISGRRG